MKRTTLKRSHHENELDGKLILSVYEKIIQHGEDHEDGKLTRYLRFF